MNAPHLPKVLRYLVLSSLLASVAALRAADQSEVGRRERRQQGRIAEGVQSGQLTPAETAALEKREALLQGQIKNDRSANGGKLTPAERAQINGELDVLSHRIYRAKHNGLDVPPAK
jgi:hypothetical protein